MKEEEFSIDKLFYCKTLKEISRKIKKNKKKIYFKKVFSLPQFSVYLVNGNFIRKNICEDFVNLGQHYYFKFIPKNEFWLDCKKSEIHFFVDYLLVENRLMQKKIPFKEASKIANFTEQKERTRSSLFRKLKQFFKKKKDLEKIRKKILINYKNKLIVWIVNGKLVRDFLDIYFAGGSHHFVDKFVPEKEIWIDGAIHPTEYKFILIHELHERNLMKTKKLKYFEAHKQATIVEDYCRKHPKKINKFLEREFRMS